MTQALTFNDVTLTPIPHQNSLWIRAAELARALGFSREDKVAQIYQRHADEFTSDMTQLIENVVEPQNEVSQNLSAGRCRIFSLRGCHLVAMFARTPVAKAFRKWVLDVLEKYAAEQTALSAAHGPAASLPLSTTEDRKPLRALVGSWAQVSGLPFAACWNQLKAAFQLANIKELPQAWLPDALAWVQQKMDTMTAPSLPTREETLTVASASPAADAEEHLAAIRQHISRIYDHEAALYGMARRNLPSRWNAPERERRIALRALDGMERAASALDATLACLEAGVRTALAAGRM